MKATKFGIPFSHAISILGSLIAATAIPIGHPGGHVLKLVYLGTLLSWIALVVALAVQPGFIFDLWKLARLKVWVGTLAAYVSWVAISSLLSPVASHPQALHFWFKSLFVPALLALLALWAAIHHPRKVFETFRIGLLGSGTLFAAVALLEALAPALTREYLLSEVRFPVSFFHYTFGVFVPRSGLFEHHNPFGLAQALCANWVFQEYLNSSTKQKRPLAKVLLWITFVVGITLSCSKTALLVFFLGHGWLLVRHRQFSMRMVLTRAPIFMIVVLGIFFLNPNNRKRTAYLFSLQEATPALNTSHLLQGRDNIYRHAIELGAEFPLTGVGFYQFGKIHVDRHWLPELIHAHNFLLSGLAESGVLGLSLLITLVLLVFRGTRGWTADLDSPYFTTWLGLAVAQTTDLFTNHILWFSLLFWTIGSLTYARAEVSVR